MLVKEEHQPSLFGMMVCSLSAKKIGKEGLPFANHSIGWVARPAHSSAPGGFKRAGKFKKACNMNYGLALSPKLGNFLLSLKLRVLKIQLKGERDGGVSRCGYYSTRIRCHTSRPPLFREPYYTLHPSNQQMHFSWLC